MTTDYGTFAHLAADKRHLYREVLRAFAAAKARFVLHLRPAEVRATMDDPPAVEAVDAALRQLVGWGNLSADPDTAEVTTVEEFYRARFLYRLTPEGEATERAIAVFEEGLIRPGELQTAALGDIRDLLGELRTHLGAASATGQDTLSEDPAALLAPARWRPLVGWVVAAFFVAVFPGNISQAVTGAEAFGLDSDAARWARLAFPPVFVAWALWSTGAWCAWADRRGQGVSRGGS